MKLRFRKPTVAQLDVISSILGAVAGIAELLVACKYISNEEGQLVAGMALIAWGFFCNKPPRKIKRTFESNLHPEVLLNELRD